MTFFRAIIQLLGGLAMFLYGIEAMGDGLKNSSGAALKRVLEKVTGNILVGVLTGTLVTAVIQSSTATIVLTVALIGAGVLTLKQAVPIVMGANIGTTITAQIIRLSSIEAGDNWFLMLFDTDTLAPIALVVGIVLLMFIKRNSFKPIGEIFIGFGILFIGLGLMTDGVKPLIGTDAFAMFLNLLSNPLLGILLGLVLTIIVQSSSATVGMLQTVAAAAAVNGGAGITFLMAYPVVLGINLGTCVTTAMVCSIGTSKDAKRTGMVHILFNTIGTVLFMTGMSLLHRFGVFGASFWSRNVDSGAIANFQTVFNLLTAVTLIPFTNALTKLSIALVREDKEELPRHPELHTLDEKLYIAPSVALSEATKAIAYMGHLAQANLDKSLGLLTAYDDGNAAELQTDENCLDQFADRADRFLIGLSKAVENQQEDRQLDMLMQTVPNFERVGDYAMDIAERAQHLQRDSSEFSDTAKQELALISRAVREILTITLKAFETDNNEAAKSIEPLEETIDDMVRILRERHTQRLKTNQCSVSSGLVFMDALTYLERAADQCSSVAVMMLARENEAILHNHYEYLKELHSGNDISYRTELQLRREQYIEPLQSIH